MYSPIVILDRRFAMLLRALHLYQSFNLIVLREYSDRVTFKPLLDELLTRELHSEQVCPRYQDLLPKHQLFNWLNNLGGKS